MKPEKILFFRKLLFLNLFFYGVFNICIVWGASLRSQQGYKFPVSSSQLLLCQEINLKDDPILAVKEKLGIDIRPLISSEVEKYGLDSGEGVVIVSLTRWSPLTRLGFEKKDIMFEVNGRPIMGPKDLNRLLNEFEHQELITIRAMDHRTGKIGYVQIFLP